MGGYYINIKIHISLYVYLFVVLDSAAVVLSVVNVVVVAIIVAAIINTNPIVVLFLFLYIKRLDNRNLKHNKSEEGYIVW